MTITQLDLFSGIGGFHLGFEKAGYKVKSYFSEVDKHAIAVYKHRFKDSEYVGSVTDVRGADLPRIDLITFGSPCQDFSQAGSREGMGGERSSLILEAIRLITECRPRVFIWENVKGAFSSNDGADFAAILQAFANIGGYRLEWQLLNTTWFLPQNRERVYLVGHLAEARGDWGGVFPITTSTGEDNGIPKQNPTTYTITNPQRDGNGSYISERSESTQEIKVKSATAAGYDVATTGDSINLTAINSTTRRGRVGKQIAQTLDTLCEQAVIQINPSLESGGKQPYQQNRVYSDEGIVPALCAHKSDLNVANNYRIRRLTPIECERLQGFPDNHTQYGDYVGEVKEMSNSQRYKQCGNAVTVDVVQAIAEKLKPYYDTQN